MATRSRPWSTATAEGVVGLSDNDGIPELLAEIIQDEETRAWTFVAHGPDGVISHGESNSEEECFTSLPAAVLVQFAVATNRDPEQYIRDVINEYNRQKGNAQAYNEPLGGETPS